MNTLRKPATRTWHDPPWTAPQARRGFRAIGHPRAQAARTRARGLFGLLIGLVWLTVVTTPAVARTYYVSTNGSDAAVGTSAATAFRTVQHAAGLAQAGDTILLREGTYREYVTFPQSGLPGSPVELAAYPDERPVLAGSEVVTNWVHYTNHIWMVPDWPLASQQVFDNGRPLLQLGWPNPYFAASPNRYFGPGSLGLADLAPNTFFYDRTNLTLYVWLAEDAAPTDRTMEVAVRLGTLDARNMWGASNTWYRVRGLEFRHSNTCALSPWGWPGVWLPAYSVLEDCLVEWNDSAGLSLGVHSTATNCVIAHNGLMGGGAELGFLFSHCTVHSNNYRNFNPAWAAAGLKLIPDTHGVIEHTEVSWNIGPGIWFDTCLTGDPVVIRDNYFHHNTQNALFVELTKNVLIQHNLFVSNRWRSLYVSSSEDVRIDHNTFAGHQDWMAVEMFFAPTRTNAAGLPFPLRNNRFENNIVYGSTCIRDLLLYADDPPYCLDNRSDYNCFFRAGGESMAVNRSSGGPLIFNSLASWAAATGWDTHSLATDPLFIDAADGAYHLSSQAGTISNGVWVASLQSSPCIDTGDPGAVFDQEPAWNGSRVNMGRYGNTPQAAKSQDRDEDGASDTLEDYVLGSNPDHPDSDGDAANDYQEYVAGTDPLSTNSLLRLLVHLPSPESGHGLELTWFGRAERRYVLQSASDLGTADWQIDTQFTGLPGLPVGEWTATNQWIQLVRPSPLPPTAQHYRLQVFWP